VQDLPVLTVIDHSSTHHHDIAWPCFGDLRVQSVLRRAGFYHCALLRWVRLDHALITALIERWRPETSTFHFPTGEMTITLQDVAVIMGLRVDGNAIEAPPEKDDNYRATMVTLLGRAPEHMHKSGIQFTWLREQFENLPDDADEDDCLQSARAYMLHMIGSVLFPDSNKNTVHYKWLTYLSHTDYCGTYSWGSAVLAYMYNEMSKVALGEKSDLSCCCSLLQVVLLLLS
jgi:hypothetical protein